MTSASTILTLGVTSNFPFASLFAGNGEVGAFVLAQSADISSVPADFVKYFFTMLAFCAALWGGVTIGRRGSKGSPLHVEQPVSVDANVSHAPVYAHQAAVDKLRADMEARTRENLRQHEEASKALTANIHEGQKRMETILNALHDMETRMTSNMLEEIKGLHQRINPLSEQTAANKSAIEGLKERSSHLWENIQQLWQQVFRKPAPRN